MKKHDLCFFISLAHHERFELPPDLLRKSHRGLCPLMADCASLRPVTPEVVIRLPLATSDEGEYFPLKLPFGRDKKI
jgi:hypothetical protein